MTKIFANDPLFACEQYYSRALLKIAMPKEFAEGADAAEDADAAALGVCMRVC